MKEKLIESAGSFMIIDKLTYYKSPMGMEWQRVGFFCYLLSFEFGLI